MTAAQASAKKPIGFAGSIAYLAMVSVFATGIASITAILLVLVFTFPFSLFPFWIPQFPNFFWNGAVMAAPVTLLLLPAVAALGRRYPTSTYFALPVAGLLGGALTTTLLSLASASFPELFGWARTQLGLGFLPSGSVGDWLIVFLGAFAGFIAGVFYSAAFREMRR